MTTHYEMEKDFESIAERINEARSAFETFDDEIDLTEEVARPALIALSQLTALMHDLREAGADLAEVPAEDEALVLVIANGALIQKAIEAEVAHMESIIDRVYG